MENVYLQEILLKPAEVARILNVSRSMVYQLIRSGDIPVIKVRSVLRIRPADLQSYIKNIPRENDFQLPLF